MNFTSHNLDFNMKLQNKKGFLLGEFTMKIIIAVLCILLLMYLLVSLYSLFTSKNKLQQAEASLNSIIEKINLVNNKGVENKPLITQPEDWVFFYDANGALTSCNGQYCLCICPKETWITGQLEKCNDDGVCKNSPVSLTLKNKIKISGLSYVKIQKESGGISLTLE